MMLNLSAKVFLHHTFRPTPADEAAINTANGCDYEDALVRFAPSPAWNSGSSVDLVLANSCRMGASWWLDGR